MSAGVRTRPRVDELVDELVAQALDVERAAAREVQQRLLALRRAERARRCSARPPRPGRRTIADPHSGQRVGIANALRVRAAACSSSDAHDLGNHVAGAADDHRVADVHVLAPDLVLVVQRRVGDGHAADEHRLQPRDRRDRAGAPDLDVDAEELGRHLLGRKLVRDRPARLARDETRARAAASSALTL